MQAADLPISPLQRISADARRLSHIVGPSQRAGPLPVVSRPPQQAADTSVAFSHPISIVSDIMHLGYSHERAAEAASRYNHVALTLKAEYEKAMKATLLQWNYEEHFTGEFKAVRSYYAASYSTAMRRIRHHILCEACKRSTTSMQAGCIADAVPPAPFKSRAVTVLEEAFARSPYPDREEKTRLAKETDLEYKQVHVWFQNRRNRSKKSGHSIKKDIFVSVRNTPRSSAGIREPAIDANSQNQATHNKFCPVDNLSCLDPSPSKTPVHAFPTTYPPACDYDPFPSTSPADIHTHWPRHAASISALVRNRTTSEDVDSLTNSFAELRIDEHETSRDYAELRGIPPQGRVASQPHDPPASARQPVTTTAYPLSLRPSPVNPSSDSCPSRYKKTLRFVQQSIPSSRRSKASTATIREATHPYPHNSRRNSSRSSSASSLDSLLFNSSTAPDSPASDSPPLTPPLTLISLKLPSRCESP